MGVAPLSIVATVFGALLLVQTAFLVLRIEGSVAWRWTLVLVPGWAFFAAWLGAVVWFAVRACAHHRRAADHDSDDAAGRRRSRVRFRLADEEATAAGGAAVELKRDVDDAPSHPLVTPVAPEHNHGAALRGVARDAAAHLCLLAALLATAVMVALRLDGVALAFEGGWAVAFSPVMALCAAWTLWAARRDAARRWWLVERAHARLHLRVGAASRLATASTLTVWPTVVGVVLAAALVALLLDGIAATLPWPAALCPLWLPMAAWLVELVDRWVRHRLVAAAVTADDWPATRAALVLAAAAYAAVLVFLVLLNVRLGALPHAPIGVAALFAPLLLLFAAVTVAPHLVRWRLERRAAHERDLAWAHVFTR